MWAEKILRKEGDDPHKPRVLLMAFTGKAASLIGKLILLHYFPSSPSISKEFWFTGREINLCSDHVGDPEIVTMN